MEKNDKTSGLAERYIAFLKAMEAARRNQQDFHNEETNEQLWDNDENEDYQR